jgi:hypothetical protein
MANYNYCSSSLQGKNSSNFISDILQYITDDNNLLIEKNTGSFDEGIGYNFQHDLNDKSNSLTFSLRDRNSISFLSFHIKKYNLSGTLVNYDIFSDFFHFIKYENGQIVTDEYNSYFCKNSLSFFGLHEIISEELSLGLSINDLDIKKYIDLGVSIEQLLITLENLHIDKSNNIFYKISSFSENIINSTSEVPF